LTIVIPASATTRVERRELPGPVADEEPEPIDVVAEVHHEVAGLLAGPCTVGMPGHASTCSQRSPTSSTNRT
jgi:hypothetical protein